MFFSKFLTLERFDFWFGSRYLIEKNAAKVIKSLQLQLGVNEGIDTMKLVNIQIPNYLSLRISQYNFFDNNTLEYPKKGWGQYILLIVLCVCQCEHYFRYFPYDPSYNRINVM